MRARIYDPKLGRFLQPDPIGYGDGMNVYAYTGGDPVNRVDPSGMAACTGSRIGEACAYSNGQGGVASGYSGWSTAGWRGDWRDDAHLGRILYHYKEERYVGGARDGKLISRTLTGISFSYVSATGSADFFLAAGGHGGVHYRLSPNSPLARAGITHIDVPLARFAHIQDRHSESAHDPQKGWFHDVIVKNLGFFIWSVSHVLNRAEIIRGSVGSGYVEARGRSGVWFGGSGSYNGPDSRSHTILFTLHRGPTPHIFSPWLLWNAFPVRDPLP